MFARELIFSYCNDLRKETKTNMKKQCPVSVCVCARVRVCACVCVSLYKKKLIITNKKHGRTKDIKTR